MNLTERLIFVCSLGPINAHKAAKQAGAKTPQEVHSCQGRLSALAKQGRVRRIKLSTYGPIRPFRVLLDVDGVLADWMAPALLAIRAVTQRKYKLDDFTEYDVFARLAADTGRGAEELGRLVFEVLEPTLHDYLKPLPGAVATVNELRATGAQVYVVTAAWHGAPARVKWLAEHFGILKDHVVFTAAKHAVTGDVFIDDRPEFVTAWQEAHPNGRAILFAQPYNRNATGYTRLAWAGIRALLLRR